MTLVLLELLFEDSSGAQATLSQSKREIDQRVTNGLLVQTLLGRLELVCGSIKTRVAPNAKHRTAREDTWFGFPCFP